MTDYKVVIKCKLCNWTLKHDNEVDGVPDWKDYAQVLRDHNTIRHSNFTLDEGKAQNG